MVANSRPKSYVQEVLPAIPAGTNKEPATDGSLALGPAYTAAIRNDEALAQPCTKTLYDNFTEAVAQHGPQPCLGHREGGAFKYLSYAEAGEAVAALGGALVNVAGLQPHARVAIMGPNSPEWMLAMQACNRQTLYCIPLYDSLGDDTVGYVIEHSEASIVVADARKLGVLAKALPKVAAQVKHLVAWGAVQGAAAEALEGIRKLGIPTATFQEFLQQGRERPTPPVPPKSDDLCTIMYTSGTTGVPKGVLLTHRMVASEVRSLEVFFRRIGVPIGGAQRDCLLSFLPLAHIYERCMEEFFLVVGMSIAYWSGDIKKIGEDIKAAEPTIFCSVPRVYERMYDVVQQKLKKAGFFKRTVYSWAFARKLAALKAGYAWDKASPRFDRRVFQPMSQQMFGPRIRIITSGGGPLSRHIEDFVRVTSCAIFVQGYGLTETCAATFVDYPDEPDHFYSVGPPQPVVQVRLEAIPEMNYSPMDNPPRGEVLVKGETVTSGYYKNEEETRKAFEADGWFHTGDVGELTPTGSLRIIDRKKNIFKLSQGEYIAVEKIEGVLLRSPLVEQAWVHGSPSECFLVAVMVPARDKLEAWAREQGIQAPDFEALCREERVTSMVLGEVTAVGKKGGLKGFELPKAVYVEGEAFSVERNLLTPTYKLRRPQLFKRYMPHVETMYRRLKEQA